MLFKVLGIVVLASGILAAEYGHGEHHYIRYQGRIREHGRPNRRAAQIYASPALRSSQEGATVVNKGPSYTLASPSSYMLGGQVYSSSSPAGPTTSYSFGPPGGQTSSYSSFGGAAPSQGQAYSLGALQSSSGGPSVYTIGGPPTQSRGPSPFLGGGGGFSGFSRSPYTLSSSAPSYATADVKQQQLQQQQSLGLAGLRLVSSPPSSSLKSGPEQGQGFSLVEGTRSAAPSSSAPQARSPASPGPSSPPPASTNAAPSAGVRSNSIASAEQASPLSTYSSDRYQGNSYASHPGHGQPGIHLVEYSGASSSPGGGGFRFGGPQAQLLSSFGGATSFPGGAGPVYSSYAQPQQQLYLEQGQSGIPIPKGYTLGGPGSVISESSSPSVGLASTYNQLGGGSPFLTRSVVNGETSYAPKVLSTYRPGGVGLVKQASPTANLLSYQPGSGLEGFSGFRPGYGGAGALRSSYAPVQFLSQQSGQPQPQLVGGPEGRAESEGLGQRGQFVGGPAAASYAAPFHYPGGAEISQAQQDPYPSSSPGQGAQPQPQEFRGTSASSSLQNFLQSFGQQQQQQPQPQQRGQ